MKAPSDTVRGHLVFALDAPTLSEVGPLVDRLTPYVSTLKIGLELFVRHGPEAIHWAKRYQLDVFLDLKLHDIPQTVERAVSAAAGLGVRYITVHAQGSTAMIERAVARAEREAQGLTVLAVTLLTSLDERDMQAQGIVASPAEQALRLAKLAYDAGARGFVCSPAEVGLFRTALGPSVLLVTPGIRPSAEAPSDDQKRTATAQQAIAAGADLIVVGRPLRDAPEPERAAQALTDEIALGLTQRTATESIA